MATKNGRNYTPVSGLNLNQSNGAIRFETPLITPVTTSGERVLYVNSSNELVYDNGSGTTVVGAAGAGSTPTWETIFASDNTFTITPDASLTIAGNRSTATDVLVITNIAGGSGSCLQITNSGTGNDIDGTSNTWGVTKLGVATFAGISISGTTSAITSTDDATWTIKDNDATALIITPSGGPVMLNFDSRNSAEVLSTAATIFQVDAGKANFLSASNTVSNVVVSNDTITTFGNGTTEDEGMVVLSSDTLTTGDLLRLQLDESALNGGAFIKAVQTDAAAAVFTVGENGATTIAGTGGSNMLTVTAGDISIADGSITLTDADNAASFTVTNDTATSASVFVLAGSGVFTGSTTTSFATITASGLTTGTVLAIPAVALTTGKIMDIDAAAATDGILIDVTGGGANMTATGRVAKLSMGAATVGQALEVVTTGVYTGVGVVTITADSATTSGATVGQGVVAISADGLTTGSALDVTSTSIVLTTGRIADFSHISGNITGTLDKTGDFFNVSSFRTVTTGTVADDYDMGNFIRTSVINGGGSFTATGSVIYVENAVTNTSGTVTDTVNGVQIVMDSLGTGSAIHVTHSAVAAIVVDLVSAATTTGKIIDISDLNALTTGKGIHIASSATAITGTGRLLHVAHSGATGGSAILNEFSTAANDETVLMKFTASDALAGGIAVDISAAAMTTGTALDISDLDALTSGIGINLVSNSADTGSFFLMKVTNDNAAATGASLATFKQDSTGTSITIDHNGVTGKSLFLDAATTTETGGILDISAAALTTGTALDIGNLDALTTGIGVNIVSNSSDTSGRALLQITNDHASANGAIPIQIKNDGVQSTNYRRMIKESNTGITLWWGNGTTGNGNLSGTAGDILFNGGSNKPEYCTGTTNWTALV